MGAGACKYVGTYIERFNQICTGFEDQDGRKLMFHPFLTGCVVSRRF